MARSSKNQTCDDKDILERVRIILGKEWQEMTTSDFIYNLKEMGYKVKWSHRNVSKRKTKIQIFKPNKKQPIAWVFTNEMY